jgi:hypothetical protein
MITLDQKFIVTMDFYFAALLMSKGFELLGSDKHEKGVVFIINNRSENAHKKLKEDFNEHNAYVNMSDFVKQQARLRKELDKHKN